ncbi:hypothetical protein J6TS7_27710 [Paenibacillus dendritiformis]|nr:hypothetical protein J6TS7_27710 [Paenibacillus dendritiformis]
MADAPALGRFRPFQYLFDRLLNPQRQRQFIQHLQGALHVIQHWIGVGKLLQRLDPLQIDDALLGRNDILQPAIVPEQRRAAASFPVHADMF